MGARTRRPASTRSAPRFPAVLSSCSYPIRRAGRVQSAACFAGRGLCGRPPAAGRRRGSGTGAGCRGSGGRGSGSGGCCAGAGACAAGGRRGNGAAEGPAAAGQAGRAQPECAAHGGGVRRPQRLRRAAQRRGEHNRLCKRPSSLNFHTMALSACSRGRGSTSPSLHRGRRARWCAFASVAGPRIPTSSRRRWTCQTRWTSSKARRRAWQRSTPHRNWRWCHGSKGSTRRRGWLRRRVEGSSARGSGRSGERPGTRRGRSCASASIRALLGSPATRSPRRSVCTPSVSLRRRRRRSTRKPRRSRGRRPRKR